MLKACVGLNFRNTMADARFLPKGFGACRRFFVHLQPQPTKKQSREKWKK